MFLADGRRVSVTTVDTGGRDGRQLASRLGRRGARRARSHQRPAHGRRRHVLDPATTYIDVDVSIGSDTVVRPRDVPGRRHDRSARAATSDPRPGWWTPRSGDRCRVRFAVANLAVLGDDVDVGPFASLRAGTELADGVQVGNYVEVKGSRSGRLEGAAPVVRG